MQGRRAHKSSSMNHQLPIYYHLPVQDLRRVKGSFFKTKQEREGMEQHKISSSADVTGTSYSISCSKKPSIQSGTSVACIPTTSAKNNTLFLTPRSSPPSFPFFNHAISSSATGCSSALNCPLPLSTVKSVTKFVPSSSLVNFPPSQSAANDLPCSSLQNIISSPHHPPYT